jgi:hypothetical protein
LNATSSTILPNQSIASPNENPLKNVSGEILDTIEEEEGRMGYHARDNSVSVSRRVRMKSSDMSKSFTEINDKRKKSLNLATQRPDDRKGGRMLSLNAEELDNSLR